MDDEKMALPAHVVSRNGVYQYVRRIPGDVIDAFSGTRIQRSLKTRDPGVARLRAAQLGLEIDKQINDARAARGAIELRAQSVGWEWSGWERFVEWFLASLVEEDTQMRLKLADGQQLANGEIKVWIDPVVFRKWIDLNKRLASMSLQDYDSERAAFVQSYANRLGIQLPVGDVLRRRVMAACLGAEMRAFEIVALRDAFRWQDHPHPDTIEGPWRQLPKKADESPALKAATSPTGKQFSKNPDGSELAELIEVWRAKRARLHKKVDEHHVNDMRNTVTLFKEKTGVSSYNCVTRQDILKFRDYLLSNTKYAIATINKKTGYITTLVEEAFGAGLIESTISGGIYLEIPEDQGKKEPFDGDELSKIFAHPLFTEGARFKRKKALGETQFWLPVVSISSGLITSEILQMGPDSICLHPDADIWCYRVTTAGSRSVKSYARERYVPIRKSMVEELQRLKTQAETSGSSFLWPEYVEMDLSLEMASRYFSDHWKKFQVGTLKIKDPQKSLYSFRHAFLDAIRKLGADDASQEALMGHAITGTKKRYGTKKMPRPVNIAALNELIQGMKLPFMEGIRYP